MTHYDKSKAIRPSSIRPRATRPPAKPPTTRDYVWAAAAIGVLVFVMSWRAGCSGGGPAEGPERPEKPEKPAPKEPAPTPKEPESGDVKGRLLWWHNNERESAGAAPLSVNARLNAAAQAHADWMAANRKMSHAGAGGSSFADRARQHGYAIRGGGENVAYGYSTPEAVMRGWMGSAGHRRNILDERWRDVGFGVAKSSDGRLYWAATFGSGNGNLPSMAMVSDGELVMPGPLEGEE